MSTEEHTFQMLHLQIKRTSSRKINRTFQQYSKSQLHRRSVACRDSVKQTSFKIRKIKNSLPLKKKLQCIALNG